MPVLLNRQRAVRVSTAAVRELLLRVGREVAGDRAFTVVLVSDAAIRRYNRDFRGKDQATDVLSFPAGKPERPAEAAGEYLGDIVISAETARRQARRVGHSIENEIGILALHGVLHLLGFDHESARDAGRMARAERRWRRHFGLPEGLIERASL